MKKLLITNNYPSHYEIIESVIVKYFDILNIAKTIPMEVYLNIQQNTPFKNYITAKYPAIKFENITNYDYYINCTFYDSDFKWLGLTNLNKKFISHEITQRLLDHSSVCFLTPLSKKRFYDADIMPFSENKVVSKTPIYIIQGNLNQNRRCLSLLTKILSKTYKYDFVIKLIGRGHLPPPLKKYQNRIILKSNLNFVDYHKQFLDAYCILPLITKKSHPHYYTTKLTSTINYAKGY